MNAKRTRLARLAMSMQLVSLGRACRPLQAFLLGCVVCVYNRVHLLAYRRLDHMNGADLRLRPMHGLGHGRLALLHQTAFCLAVHHFDHAFALWACPRLLGHELRARLHSLVGIEVFIVLTLPGLLVLVGEGLLLLGGLSVLEHWVHCVLCQGALAFLENAIRQILALRVLLLSLSLMVTSAADRVVASVLMHLVVPLENLRRVQSVARRVLNHQLRVVDRFAAPDAIEPLVSGVLLAACLLRDRGADDLLLDLSNTFVEFRLHLQIDLAFEVGHCAAHSGAILREHA